MATVNKETLEKLKQVARIHLGRAQGAFWTARREWRMLVTLQTMRKRKLAVYARLLRDADGETVAEAEVRDELELRLKLMRAEVLAQRGPLRRAAENLRIAKKQVHFNRSILWDLPK